MKNPKLQVTAATLVTVMLASSVGAGVVNGGFESPNLGYALVQSGSTFGGWTCVGDNVEFVRAEAAPTLPGLEVSAFEGDYWVDLGGVGGASGIYQDLSGLAAGQWYRVSFAQAGNVWGPDVEFTLQVSWNGAQVGSFSSVNGGDDGAHMNWQQRYVDVQATGGTDRLQFFSPVVVLARGAALDAVSIALVPAPGALMAFGLAGRVAKRRRSAA